jgi:uncharacterized membrane protein YoaK (UPF0700 family)
VGEPAPDRRDTTLLLVMVVAAAATDAISYLGLGKVFPANMTGNTVLLGIGLATGDLSSAGRSAVALGGFVLGAAITGASGHGRGWASEPLFGAASEAALVITALLWWLIDPHPVRLALIVLLSLAMGGQSAAISRLGFGVSTTYITGTWTATSSWVGRRLLGRRTDTDAAPDTGPGTEQRHRLQAAVVVSYFGTACLAAYLFHNWQAWALTLPAAALVAATTGCVGIRANRVHRT